MFFTWKSNVGGNMKDALHMSIQRGKNVRRLVAVHCNMRSQFSLLHGVLDQLMYSLNCHWGSKSPWRFLYFVFIVKGAISAITQCNMVCVCVSRFRHAHYGVPCQDLYGLCVMRKSINV